MGKKAGIFDMDGVIFDTERLYLEIWKSVFEKYGYKMTKELYITVMGTGRKNVIKTFLENFGDDLPIEKMYEEKDNQLFYIIENQGIPLKKGVKELFSMLKEKNYKILIESQNEGVKIAIAGTKHELMYALAHLSSTLLKESNLSERDIKRAVEIGLTPKEEIEKL